MSEIKYEIKTVEQAFAVVHKDPWGLKHVPEEFKTYEVCLAAMHKEPRAIAFVPEEMKTYEVCHAVFEKDTFVLGYIPEELKTYEMCLAAVKQMGYTLRFVPEKFRSYEICLAAAQNDIDYNGFEYVPDEFRTSEFCFLAVKHNSRSLKYVPEKYLTPEFLLKVVQFDTWNIQDIPDKFFTDALATMLLDDIHNISATFDKEKAVGYFVSKFPSQYRKEVIQRIKDTCGIVLVCRCEERKTKNISVIEMKPRGEGDDDMWGTIEHVKWRGQEYWWLYLSQCQICNEYWLVGQDHRINDIYCLHRLNAEQANEIIANDNWPNIFDKFETLLEIAKEHNIRWSFCCPVNDSPLGDTIENLALERPFIKVSELSKLLNINTETALLLSNRVMENNASVKITLDV